MPHVVGFHGARHQYKWNPGGQRLGPHQPQHLIPVYAGKIHIAQHEVRDTVSREGDAGGPIARLQCRKSVLSQGGQDGGPQPIIVVNYQDGMHANHIFSGSSLLNHLTI
jgi:hypothetical protein